jgi:hypothetical protein
MIDQETTEISGRLNNAPPQDFTWMTVSVLRPNISAPANMPYWHVGASAYVQIQGFLSNV